MRHQKTKDILWLLAVATLVLACLAGSRGTALAQMPTTPGGTVAFYATLDAPAEQTLATSGPLKLVARCEVGSGVINLTLIGTSRKDGWFVVGPGGPVGLPAGLTAGQTVLVDADAKPVGTPDLVTTSFAGEVHLIDKDFDLSFGTAAFGFGVFGHDCIVAGTAAVIRRTP
ncbi:MAG: hypothetical protein HYS05_14685 [Acidobacteria bacterium]|nr:hypothetical protein [Acidobacteriota bacterium]